MCLEGGQILFYYWYLSKLQGTARIFASLVLAKSKHLHLCQICEIIHDHRGPKMAGKKMNNLYNQHAHSRIEGDTTIWNLAMVVIFSATCQYPPHSSIQVLNILLHYAFTMYAK